MYSYSEQKNDESLTHRGIVAACWIAVVMCVFPNLAAQSASSQKLPVQIIYLGYGGCQPSEIHNKGGKFQLYVINLSPKRDLQLTFHPENGADTSNKHVKDDDHEWIQPVDLHPGRYVVEATNSPEHRCSVVVE
jgi:hypothetical protein